MHYFAADLIFNMWVGKIHSKVDWDFSPRKNYLLFGINSAAFAYQAPEVYKYSNQQINKIIRTENYYLGFIKKVETSINEAEDIFEKVNSANLEDINVNEIVSLFKEFYSSYFNLTFPVGDIRNINWTVEKRLVALLKKRFG